MYLVLKYEDFSNPCVGDSAAENSYQFFQRKWVNPKITGKVLKCPFRDSENARIKTLCESIDWYLTKFMSVSMNNYESAFKK